MLAAYHHLVPLSRNLETVTSWNPMGHSRPVMGLLYFYVYTIPGRQVAVATKFCIMVFNVCGSSVWNLVLVTLMGAWNFQVVPRFLENFYTPLLYAF